MKLTENIKQQIDKMTYSQLLYKHRFSPIGDPLFEGESGEYFAERMKELRIDDENHSKVSKEIGW